METSPSGAWGHYGNYSQWSLRTLWKLLLVEFEDIMEISPSGVEDIMETTPSRV